MSEPKTSSYVSREAFRGKNHAKYEYMKLYLNLNFQQLFLPGFSKLHSTFSFMGSIWKFILQNTQLKQVEMENHNEESSHSVEKNFPSRIFTIGKNTSKYSLFIELNCEKSAKKIKITFCFCMAFLSKRKSENLNYSFAENVKSSILYKKFEGSRFSKYIRSRDLSKKFVTAIKNTCAKTSSFTAEVVSSQASWETWCLNTIFWNQQKLGMPVKLEFWKLSQKNRNKFCWISTEVQYLLKKVI